MYVCISEYSFIKHLSVNNITVVHVIFFSFFLFILEIFQTKIKRVT
jgi:hypothetical protein